MTAAEATTDWLRAALLAGPRYAYDVLAEGSMAGHERLDLRLAKRRLAVVVTRDATDGWDRAQWTLPAQAVVNP